MSQSNYQEPIEKEDLDLQKKFGGSGDQPGTKGDRPRETAEVSAPEAPQKEKIPSIEKEIAPEAGTEKVSEKIETARKTIQTQKTSSTSTMQSDAQSISEITDYEKKVEKLVELALQKGPDHAIRVARHMDVNDNYTMDELHDKMLEDDLRKQLIQKGLLKEL